MENKTVFILWKRWVKNTDKFILGIYRDKQKALKAKKMEEIGDKEKEFEFYIVEYNLK